MQLLQEWRADQHPHGRGDSSIDRRKLGSMAQCMEEHADRKVSPRGRLPRRVTSLHRSSLGICRQSKPAHLPPITLTNAKKSTNPEWEPPRPFVYTPLHGVGGSVFPGLCRSVGIYDYSPVPEQLRPNPDFPTVSFPNPEEAGALDLAMQTADKDGITLIIAHDPDADRFAAAEKVKYVCSPVAAAQT